MKIRIVVLIIAFVIHATAVMAKDQAAIGRIKVSKGNTFVLRDGERMSGELGREVFQQDVLETGKDGSLGVTLKDNTRLSLGPDSRLALKEFNFNPKEEEYSFLSEMTRGTLVYLSGMMSKLSPESVSVKTPSATIGIRGTQFLIRIGDEKRAQISDVPHPREPK